MTEICDYCDRPFDRSGSKYCNFKEQHKHPDTADLIVEEIELDLEDRRGLGDEFGACDSDIKQEIRDSWASIVRKHLESTKI